MRLDVKWPTRLRLQYIEIMAFYTGVVTRSDVAKAFGISDAAATKDLKLYGGLAPGNLTYTHSLFGFVPTASFVPAFADLSPAAVLPVIAANLAIAGGPYGTQPIYGLETASLPLPTRLPGQQVLAQVTRAMHNRRKLKVSYRSLSDRESQEERILEPHALVNTGIRWHVRAYSESTCDFRDFVLSRLIWAQCSEEPAESSVYYDDDWVELVCLELTPHTGLDLQKQESLLLDYGAAGQIIEVKVRRALIGYVLQRLNVDTTVDHTLNPSAYQLMLRNRDEIEPFAGWAFQQ
ncbi:MAG: helix-turn-helix transcriptional regulator [Thiobacillaceae bacterium]